MHLGARLSGDPFYCFPPLSQAPQVAVAVFVMMLVLTDVRTLVH